MKRLFAIFLLILLSGVAGLGYLAFVVLEKTPLVTNRSAVATSQHAERVKYLIERYQAGATQGGSEAELRVTERDLESLLAFAARGVPAARADAQISAQGLEARMTIGLPANPLGRYLNLSFGLLPSEQGVLLRHVTIGGASFPPGLLLPLLGWGLDSMLGEGSGDSVISTISAVRFSSQAMTMVYAPPDVAVSEDLMLRIADPERVQVYYMRLQEIAAELRGGYTSLTRYMAPLFELAVHRSTSAGADAADENRAAILALAIYFGDSRIAKLAGNSNGKYFSGSKLGSHNVTVKGRHDLVQHYLTSAGLQLAAGVDIANAIGEFKEFADTLRGGSGFSFSDIAGDRAGVALAERAVNAEDAQRIQTVLSQVKSEADYFPDIAGLPDNLTQDEFERRYGDVESARYLELVAEIERRISRIPAYGGG